MLRVQKLNVQLQINDAELGTYLAKGFHKVEKPVVKSVKPSKKQPEKANKKPMAQPESVDDAE